MNGKTYKLNGDHGSKKKWLLIIPIILLLAGGIRLAWHTPTLPKPATRTPLVRRASPEYTNVNGKYLFSGTVMLGRAVETYAKGNYNQPFSGMASLGSYDEHIGVLECPITNNSVSYATEVNSLIFNCKPAWVPTLVKNFPVIDLSSNHFNDQGPEGIAQTFKFLQAAHAQTVGNFNPHTNGDNCKSVVLAVHMQNVHKQLTDGSMPVAMCSFNYKTIFSPAPGELESIQKWSKLMPVIGLMNGSPEYEHQAGAAQVSVAHKMIDFGASFVVGNGTHWVQNTEVYKGKLIVYSMGNFIFDQLDYDGRIALNLSVDMNIVYDDNVGKWLKVGADCRTDTASCLEQANGQGLQKVNPSFTFDAIGSYGGDRQVATRANAQQQNDIEQRANWPHTQQLLAQQNQ